MEAAAEQQVLAARHRAAQQETAAEAKQLRAEVRKLTQQLATSRHSSRCGCQDFRPREGMLVLYRSSWLRPGLAIWQTDELVWCAVRRSSTAGSEPALSPEASQPFGKQVEPRMLRTVHAPGLHSHHAPILVLRHKWTPGMPTITKKQAA